MQILMNQNLLALGAAKRVQGFQSGFKQRGLKRTAGALPYQRQLSQPTGCFIHHRPKGFPCADPKPRQSCGEKPERLLSSGAGKMVTRFASLEQQRMLPWIIVKEPHCAFSVPEP